MAYPVAFFKVCLTFANFVWLDKPFVMCHPYMPFNLDAKRWNKFLNGRSGFIFRTSCFDSNFWQFMTSWTNLKNTTVLPSKNSCGYFLGNLLNDLGYSLLQHLATMIIILLSKLDVLRNIFIADQQILLKQNNVSDALMYFKPLFSLFWFIDTLTEAESWFSNWSTLSRGESSQDLTLAIPTKTTRAEFKESLKRCPKSFSIEATLAPASVTRYYVKK